MSQLNSVMSSKEIREFGSLVSAYRSELPVDEFCSQLQVLYGESRRHLLKGMWGGGAMCMLSSLQFLCVMQV